MPNPDELNDGYADMGNIPPVLLTRAAGNLRLTARLDILSLWLLVTLGPLAVDTDDAHPLAGDRPVATTDSDDPLTRWEVETVAENLAAVQHAQRQLGNTDARSILTRLANQANASDDDDLEAVGVAVEEDEVEHLLQTLNRVYVRMRTTDGPAIAVGAAQSPAMFLGVDETDMVEALGLPPMATRQQQAEFMIAMAIAETVELLSAQLYR